MRASRAAVIFWRKRWLLVQWPSPGEAVEPNAAVIYPAF
jgi:hypothetical protein